MHTQTPPPQTSPLGPLGGPLCMVQGVLQRLLLAALPSAWFHPAAELWARRSLFWVPHILWDEPKAGCWPDSLQNHFNPLRMAASCFFRISIQKNEWEEEGRGMHRVIRMARKGGRKKVRCEGLKRPRYWVTFHFPRCHASPRVHVFTFAEPFVWKDLPKSLVYLEISDMETTSPPSTPWSFPDCLLLRPVNF